MAFLEAELHLLRDQLGTFELRMRAIELGNEKAASSTLAIGQSIKMNPSINHSSGAANCKSTLRSRLFMAMQQMINLVDSAQKAPLGRHKTTANQVLQSSQVYHHHKPKADVVLV
ncbi:hypothetical protein BY996DRAFT_6411415 [Phakopsora pachyrhizi]|nr:hypothetical protein BY996DRAFT_6411415 [Phakopsora pachyrhizi]